MVQNRLALPDYRSFCSVLLGRAAVAGGADLGLRFPVDPAGLHFILRLDEPKDALGADMPTGKPRVAWNIRMGGALLIILPSRLRFEITSIP